VEVESRASSRGRVVTRISDNGPGIPLALRRKIFGRFVRLGSELERSQAGTGLGLYIVRTLVTRMRGKVTVRSRAHRPGTTFEVDLPGRPCGTGAVA
jgi:signal transduction histidine kinase